MKLQIITVAFAASLSMVVFGVGTGSHAADGDKQSPSIEMEPHEPSSTSESANSKQADQDHGDHSGEDGHKDHEDHKGEDGHKDHEDHKGEDSHKDHEDHKGEDGHKDHEDHKGEDGHKDHEDHKGEDGHKDHKGHEEGKAVISPDSAKRMGIKTEEAGPARIKTAVPLTGRISVNQNTKADVRGRFRGVVRTVAVNLGDRVNKDELLAVIESNESLNNYNVTSPIDGIVLGRFTNIGDVAGDNRLFMIANLSDVWAKFHVFPKDAEQVRAGQTVEVRSLEGDRSATGKIDLLFPTTDALSQTQVAIVVLQNPEGRWRPGMTVEGEVLISEREVPVSVRESALQRMEVEGDVVFVRVGTAFDPRSVEVGDKSEGWVEITNGLNAGEVYVAEQSFVVKSDLLKATAEHSH